VDIARERLVAEVSNVAQDRRGRGTASDGTQVLFATVLWNSRNTWSGSHMSAGLLRSRHGLNDPVLNFHRSRGVRVRYDRGKSSGPGAGCTRTGSVEGSGCS